MNKISPKTLLNSKWTHLQVSNKEKHFMVTMVEFDENQSVIKCVIEAVMNNNEYEIDWRELKSNNEWRMGWK
ncbi:TIGR02450 family Trp-rich protein [Vibrio sp. YMD68]|uniref:TIGR02450 family Trp-rich protein n=1 Tax=Vibrio sp. YMD68 TaxID=3042300 RepID=UPI002499DBF8|nr:TIGR02450 family Trp-rich protein [Vibrio sp. YMD68]WGV98351.1 TIGR02450 family Trp-rich protein [Vibrio sp. YMD68]